MRTVSEGEFLVAATAAAGVMPYCWFAAAAVVVVVVVGVVGVDLLACAVGVFCLYLLVLLVAITGAVNCGAVHVFVVIFIVVCGVAVINLYFLAWASLVVASSASSNVI